MDLNWRSWPGLAPAGEFLFFALPKKRNQKKGEPDALSLRFATGTLRCSRRAGEAQNSLRSDMRLSFPARHCATRQGIRRVVPTGLCFARPGFGSPRCSRDDEVGESRTSPNSHRGRSEAIHPPPPAVGRAEQHSRWRKQMRRCLSPQGEFLRIPPVASSARHRVSGPGSGCLFLWFLSFGQAKERNCAVGRNPGQRTPDNEHRPTHSRRNNKARRSGPCQRQKAISGTCAAGSF